MSNGSNLLLFGNMVFELSIFRTGPLNIHTASDSARWLAQAITDTFEVFQQLESTVARELHFILSIQPTIHVLIKPCFPIQLLRPLYISLHKIGHVRAVET